MSSRIARMIDASILPRNPAEYLREAARTIDFLKRRELRLRAFRNEVTNTRSRQTIGNDYPSPGIGILRATPRLALQLTGRFFPAEMPSGRIHRIRTSFRRAAQRIPASLLTACTGSGMVLRCVVEHQHDIGAGLGLESH